MKRVFGYIVLLAVSLAPSTLLGQQVKARVAGLESNQEYMDLLVQEKRLQMQEDSIVKVVADTRQSFRTNPENREQYGAEILRLEQELFDVRNKRGVLIGRINAIEQEWVISNLGKRGRNTGTDTLRRDSTVVRTQDSAVPNLVFNAYFGNHLSPGDYAALIGAQAKEQSVLNYLQIFRNNYYTIRQLSQDYAAVVRAEPADSIFRKYETLVNLNAKIADSVSSIWSYIFDNKTYAYSYLLDRMNRNDLLALYEDKLQALRQKEAENRNVFMADAVGFYPWKKKFVLEYEKQLAELLKLGPACDSLSGAMAVLDSLDFDFPAIVIRERLFLDYANIEVATPAKYNTRNPIPPCTVYPRGTIYRLLLGSFLKPQVPSIFRGVYPLGVLKGDDGRYRYFAGGYPTLAEAEEAQAQLKRIGFRRPEIVVWEDSLYRNISEEMAAAAEKGESAASGTVYRIEIRTGGDALGDNVRAVIAALAEGKELVRVAMPASEGDSARYMFIVGSFSTKEAAEKIASAIRQQDATLAVKIVGITL